MRFEAGRVRRISPSGATTTLVIEQNSIDAMAGMATDKQGNAYVGVGRQIRAIASNGSVTPFFHWRRGLAGRLQGAGS